MSEQRVGIIHPGQMGISIAASAQNSGNEVFWASEGRSEASRARAEEHGLNDAGSLARARTTAVVGHHRVAPRARASHKRAGSLALEQRA